MENYTVDTHQQPTLICRVFEGLCNRINAIVSASVMEPSFQLEWSVNKHCPVKFEDVFFPIPGVEVINSSAAEFDYRISTTELCWFYIVNPKKIPASKFVPLVKKQYRFVLSKLRHRPEFTLPSRTMGLTFRAHGDPKSIGPLEPFLHHAITLLKRKNISSAYINSDSQEVKSSIEQAIREIGVETFTSKCQLMKHDFDRSPENVIGMAQRLILLSQCTQGIVTNSTRSSVSDSARGFDIPIYRTFDDGYHRSRKLNQGGDYLFVNGLEGV